jgi:hypothetical protein
MTEKSFKCIISDELLEKIRKVYAKTNPDGKEQPKE